ncbi:MULTISPECIES: DUF7507 domain-containing protein [unclassified Leucobacter]|uniref:DUF7507 domain-containing protein n=1 Tax=unclassified Leucobacter TaxID=2621730 RepID=UPI0030190307
MRVNREPGSRSQLARLSALGLAGLLAVSGLTVVTTAAGETSAEAAPQANQIWAVPAGPTSGAISVGQARGYTFGVGADAITATERITSVTNNTGQLNSWQSNSFPGGAANSTAFLTPTPTNDVPLASRESRAGRVSYDLTFSKPVQGLLYHIVNVDNVKIDISGSNEASEPLRISTLSKNDVLQVDEAARRINTVRANTGTVWCQGNDGSFGNGRCGSFSIGPGAVSKVSVSETIDANDGWGWYLSYPTSNLTKSFAPAPLRVGETTYLTYTITNPDVEGQVGFTGLEFTDKLPAWLELPAGTQPVLENCGTATSVTLTGGVVDASKLDVARGGVCTIKIPYTPETTGSFPFTTDELTSGSANLVDRATGGTLVVVEPKLTVKQTVSPAGSDAYRAGQRLDYTFTVKNSGTEPLTGVTLDTSGFGGSGVLKNLSCTPALPTDLAVNAESVCTADYELTQEDIDRGSVLSPATATGSVPAGGTLPGPVTSGPSKTELTIEHAPELELVQTTETTKIDRAGQRVRYSFTVTNNGNVSLTDPGVEITSFSGAGKIGTPVCPATPNPLLPGQSIECSVEYTTVPGDLNGKPLTLQTRALAGGTVSPVTSDPSQDQIPTARVDPAQPKPKPTPGGSTGSKAAPSAPLAKTGGSIAGPAIGSAALLLLGATALFVRRARKQNALR